MYEVRLEMKCVNGKTKKYLRPFDDLKEARKFFNQEFDEPLWEHIELWDEENGKMLDGR